MLGGCCIEIGKSPIWHCKKCDRGWGELEETEEFKNIKNDNNE